METALTRLAGVRHPIVQTGMGWVAGPANLAPVYAPAKLDSASDQTSARRLPTAERELE